MAIYRKILANSQPLPTREFLTRCFLDALDDGYKAAAEVLQTIQLRNMNWGVLLLESLSPSQQRGILRQLEKQKTVKARPISQEAETTEQEVKHNPEPTKPARVARGSQTFRKTKPQGHLRGYLAKPIVEVTVEEETRDVPQDTRMIVQTLEKLQPVTAARKLETLPPATTANLLSQMGNIARGAVIIMLETPKAAPILMLMDTIKIGKALECNSKALNEKFLRQLAKTGFPEEKLSKILDSILITARPDLKEPEVAKAAVRSFVPIAKKEKPNKKTNTPKGKPVATKSAAKLSTPPLEAPIAPAESLVKKKPSSPDKPIRVNNPPISATVSTRPTVQAEVWAELGDEKPATQERAIFIKMLETIQPATAARRLEQLSAKEFASTIQDIQPKSLAAIFVMLSLDRIAPLLVKMAPSKITAILEMMTPEKVVSLVKLMLTNGTPKDQIKLIIGNLEGIPSRYLNILNNLASE